jgi:hypothetical protein
MPIPPNTRSVMDAAIQDAKVAVAQAVAERVMRLPPESKHGTTGMGKRVMAKEKLEERMAEKEREKVMQALTKDRWSERCCPRPLLRPIGP